MNGGRNEEISSGENRILIPFSKGCNFRLETRNECLRSRGCIIQLNRQ